jgi:cytoskeleton protein RodZ
MTPGATLRQARGARKLSCEQVSRATRIPHRIIVAMEQDEWSKVPGGIFARGHLRAYAREVGLDADALAAQFDAMNAPPPEIAEAAGGVAQAEAPPAIVHVQLPVIPGATRRWLAGSATIALLLLVYVAGRWSTSEDRRSSALPAPRAAAVPATALGGGMAHPVGTSAPVAETDGPERGVAGLSGGRAPAGDVTLPRTRDEDAPLVVDAAVVRSCWVTASADGARTVYRIVHPGERLQLRGRVLRLRVGDAGALQLSVEGAQARPLGASGEVATIRITRENYRLLLQTIRE